MNPYRKAIGASSTVEETPERDDEMVVVGVWFFLGCLLVLSDVEQSGPWGVAFSLGMIVLIVVLGALWRNFGIRLRGGLQWARRDEV